MDDRIIYRAEVTEFQVPGLKFKERHRATILGSHAKVAKSAKGRPVLQGGTELAEKNECGPEMVWKQKWSRLVWTCPARRSKGAKMV